MNINDELKKLIKLKSSIENRLSNTHVGMLSFSKSHGNLQYYLIIPGEKKKYLSKKDEPIIRQLAQKYYDTKVSEFLDKQISYFLSFNETINPNGLQNIYLELPEELQRMVSPCEMTAEQYINWWKNLPFVRNPQTFKNEYITQNGERVRSKSEAIIADRLKAWGIPYKYECPIQINQRTFYPDFTILDVTERKEIIFEHFGMMDDISYVNHFISKMNLYISAGYIPGLNFFYTFESYEYPLNTKQLDNFIKKVLFMTMIISCNLELLSSQVCLIKFSPA